MKLIIAGSRSIDEIVAYAEIVKLRILDNSPIANVTEIVSGRARGPDKAGEVYGDFYDIPIKKFPADWNKFGKRAGPIRNAEMAKYADMLLLIWDGKSRGSLDMRQRMVGLGKPIVEVILK